MICPRGCPFADAFFERRIIRRVRRCFISSALSTIRSRRPSGSGSLGRRLAERLEQHTHRDSGRASFALHHSREGEGQGHRQRRIRTEQTGSQAACGTAPIDHMGPRHGTRSAQAIHSRHRRAGLLLRSAKPVAAGHEREYQRTAPAVLPQRHESGRLLARRSEQDSLAIESTAQKDIGFRDACR
jgi:hypothetical protein